jgi:hypothetical protein
MRRTEEKKGVEHYKEEKISNCIEKLQNYGDVVAMCERGLLLTYTYACVNRKTREAFLNIELM